MEAFPYRFLTFLETREQRLLSWGFYDVAFTPNEIVQLINSEGDEQLREQWHDVSKDWTMEDFIGELAKANLLFQLDGNSPRFRTRFAESIRLIARLKQMFREDQWATGSNLVSDIKLHLKQRRYPQRDQTVEMCWNDMREHATKSGLQHELFAKLAKSERGSSIEFSAFQSRAFAQILSKYNSPGASGTVICAGTGAGKTKAFYVPAILGAATELSGKPFTKIIAIYPRNVLLADQFREALAEVMKLNADLKSNGIRPFKIGALLGSTPYSGWFEKGGTKGQKTLAEKYGGWRARGNGDFIIPYLRSPLNADEELVWREADRRAGRTCLYRNSGHSSTPDVPDGMLALTREDLMASPPDILFLSLEMLNREMGNPQWAKTFGIRERDFTPRLLLLDEVHSYEGIHGAQVAWVLRRWRHATKSSKLHVVGLSATLKQAQEHLARVSAVISSEIVELRPVEHELEEESIEYNVVVKGDPASGTSLLSTSIQCGMLLSRTLTPANHIPKRYQLPVEPDRLFGKKVFGFTDNLDVVNRWLSDMTDAERNRLARLRLNPRHANPRPDPGPTDDELARRNLLGQIWDLPRRLGFDLTSPLRVGRCSSQDPGLASNDDLVIATSSLEVGFDDPQVGAVMQHKRPMSIASFIQRKGRAGRTRGSRPWTMVILSDYGGDRIAFQQAERLFEPELDELNLPYLNQYVLRIQATLFLIDWIGRRVGVDAPYNYLRQPSKGYSTMENAQARVREILEDFLNQGVEWKAFREDTTKLFCGPLCGPFTRLSEGQVESLFWELPRPLLRHVVPCLLRKLDTQWRYAKPGSENDLENKGVTYPLPEFLPSATFAELDVTETRMSFETNGNFEKDDEFLDISQVLTESCPARASKRFSTRPGDPGFWHNYSPNLTAGENLVSAKTLFPSSLDLGIFQGVHVFQPESVAVSYRPNEVLDSSYGTWNWKNSFRPFGSGYGIPVFGVEPWTTVVQSIRAFLHRDQSGIDVTRFADSFDFEIRLQRGKSTIGSGKLQGLAVDGVSPMPEAVGFQRRVDGIQIQIKQQHLVVPHLPDDLMARFRADYYLKVLQTNKDFSPEINGFLREWAWRISLAMLSATALNKNCSLQEAQGHLLNKRVAAAERVIESIFHVRDPSLHEQEGRLVENIRALWRDQSFVEVISRAEAVLWNQLGDEFADWVVECYVSTLSHAFRVACTSTDTEINESDLIVDVIKSAGDMFIYLSERQSGGLGVIEKIVQRLSSDPNRFHNGMRHVLDYCQREKNTDYLLAVVESVQTNADLATSLSSVRSAKGFSGQEKSKLSLQSKLSENGFDATRDRFVSLMTNVLKPGSSAKTDELIREINQSWRTAERRLQVGIDPRVYAYSVLQDSSFRPQLESHFRQLNGQANPTPAQLYSATERFLLPTCPDSCPECLMAFNRFNDFGAPSRELANLWLGLITVVLEITDPSDDWPSLVRSGIVSNGMFAIRFSSMHATKVMSQLNVLFSMEVEVGILFHPMSIQRIEKDGSHWIITLQLKDLIHG